MTRCGLAPPSTSSPRPKRSAVSAQGVADLLGAIENVKIDNLVSVTNRGGGTNLEGTVQDSTVETCHIEHTYEDTFAALGK